MPADPAMSCEISDDEEEKSPPAPNKQLAVPAACTEEPPVDVAESDVEIDPAEDSQVPMQAPSADLQIGSAGTPEAGQDPAVCQEPCSQVEVLDSDDDVREPPPSQPRFPGSPARMIPNQLPYRRADTSSSSLPAADNGPICLEKACGSSDDLPRKADSTSSLQDKMEALRIGSSEAICKQTAKYVHEGSYGYIWYMPHEVFLGRSCRWPPRRRKGASTQPSALQRLLS